MNPQVPSDFEIFPVQASTVAADVDLLYISMVALTAFLCIVIPGVIVYFSVKYRRRPGVPRPPRMGTSLVLELTWTIIPFFIVIGMFFWGSHVFFLQTTQDPNALEILTTGKQWMWKFQHKNGRREIQDLHLPVNTPIRLKMASEDVLHSVFIPAFRLKQDVLPGRFSYLNFTPNRVGVYHLFCNQYCGTSHSQMVGKVVVMELADYQKWLGGFTGDPPEKVGEALFTSLACNTCHTGDTGSRGPLLNGLYGHKVQLQGGNVVTADDNYLRESILNSQAKVVFGYQPIMPSFNGVVSQDQVNALIAYIKTLPAGQDTGSAKNTAAADANGGVVMSPEDQASTTALNNASITSSEPSGDVRITSDSQALQTAPNSSDIQTPQDNTNVTSSSVMQNQDADTTAGEAASPQPTGLDTTTTTGEQQGVL